MRIAPEINAACLVLLGNFNPSIFTPAWFGWRGLLAETMVDAANLKVAQPQLTVFQADWLELQIIPNRFLISTAHPPFVRLQDLVVRIFREELPHTPLTAVGVNRQVHFLVNSSDRRDRMGRQLAPIEPWGDWGKRLDPDGMHGGMTSLTMTQVQLQDRLADDRLNVTVQPSNKIGQDGTGVYIEVNDHYTIKDPASQSATSEIVAILEDNFDHSIRSAERIIDHIMSLGGE